MPAHVFRRFVQGVPAVDILEVSLKVQPVSLLKPTEDRFHLGLLCAFVVDEVILKTQLPLIFRRQVVDTRADEPYRAARHLL